MQTHLQRYVMAIPYYHTKEINFPLQYIAEPDNEIRITFPRQLDWERHYMLQAGKYGCLVFWIPAESQTSPRQDGHYANDTLGEIARWSVELKYNPTLKIVVGIDPGFYSRDQIERNWRADNPHYPKFCSTFAETVE